MKLSKFKIGLCQLTATSDKKNNIDKARSSIETAADHGAKLVILPEMWNCPYSSDYFKKFSENLDDEYSSPSFAMLSQVASRRKITIIGGSIPEMCCQQLYNTCCVFAPNGQLLAKHRKLHMFDVEIPGDITFKESDTFSSGSKPTIVDTDVGRIGIGICHDIRFPELAMLYRDKGAHLICYPGAFNMSTGEALWELELEQRARAVDNQVPLISVRCYLLTVTGFFWFVHNSTLVSPLGKVIATAGRDETTLVAEVDYSEIELARENMPIDKQRRGDIYRLIHSRWSQAQK